MARKRKKKSSSRRRRQNPGTAMVAAAPRPNRGKKKGRRRGRRNPGMLNRVLGAVPAAFAAVGVMLAGFATATTVQRTMPGGFTSTGPGKLLTTAAGSVGAATLAGATRLVRREGTQKGLIIGAAAAPLLRITMDLLKGVPLPFGISLALEDSMPFRLSDYLTNRASDGLSDYFRYEPNVRMSRERLAMSGYGGSGRFAPFESA